jgi:hypothetical protein
MLQVLNGPIYLKAFVRMLSAPYFWKGAEAMQPRATEMLVVALRGAEGAFGCQFSPPMSYTRHISCVCCTCACSLVLVCRQHACMFVPWGCVAHAGVSENGSIVFFHSYMHLDNRRTTQVVDDKMCEDFLHSLRGAVYLAVSSARTGLCLCLHACPFTVLQATRC